MASEPSPTRPVVGLAALGSAIVLVILTVLLFQGAQSKHVGEAEQTRDIDEDQLILAREALELATLDLVVVRMLDGIGVDGDRTARLTASAARAQAAVGTIEVLAMSDSPVASEAAILLEEIDTDAIDDPENGDIDELFYMADDAARWAGTDGIVTTRRDAIHELSFAASLPHHVVVEGIAGDIAVSGRPVDPSISPFVDSIIDIVRTDGGWYGMDADVPLDDSVWIEIDAARGMLPNEVGRLNALTAASPLVAYDAWARELGDGDNPSPSSPSEVVDWADALAAELSAVMNELVADEQAGVVQALDDARSERRLLLAASAATAVFAILTLVAAWRSFSHTLHVSRKRAELATRDALTGVGNRHALEVRSRADAQDERFDHHVVVMVDLDQFKMVNDVYGHAAGDELLVAIAARLCDLADHFSSEQPNAECSVIRLGGDEFLVTLHGEHPFDVDEIRARLETLRTQSVQIEHQQIDLDFSMGVVARTGPSELAKLMRAADVGVYDDKAERALERLTHGARGSSWEADQPPLRTS